MNKRVSANKAESENGKKWKKLWSKVKKRYF